MVNKKAITNQRTPQEIKERVAEIDKTVPDGDEFVNIMENEDKKEQIENNPEPVITEDPLKKDEIIIEDTEEEDDTDVPEKEEEDNPDNENPQPVKKPLPPVEDRYRESTQESMILNSKNKKILQTIDEAENLPEPTLEELQAFAKENGAEYDELDTFAQNLLKETLQNKRYRGKIGSLVADERNMQNWVTKVETFLESEETLQRFPELANLSDEFIKYATKKTHMNSDFDLLVAGFMYKNPKPSTTKKSLLLPRGAGNGGMSKGSTPTEPTEDDAIVYRTKDHKKYKEMIKKKKFKITI